ncbi:MAG: glycine cleavage T C-terminal barrel domain-containing protein [Thermoanaerobaculia bacterium]
MSPDGALTALRGGAAAARAPVELLEVAGNDREKLLHGLVTAEVRNLAAGESRHGFFTLAKGGILADFRLFARTDRLLLLLPAGSAVTVGAHLAKYQLMADVAISPASAATILETRRGDERSALETRAAAAGAVLLPDPLSAHGRLFLVSGESAGEEELAEALGLALVDEATGDLARIEDGELRGGIDFDDGNFPQETGREAAVSYTKGCFLGQEIVARIHYRGGVQRVPVGLRFAGDLPAAGTGLLADGRPVGRATSTATSPSLGPVGLAIVHRRGAEPGSRLELASGGHAEVVSLPFHVQGGVR